MDIFIYAIETIYRQEYEDTAPAICGFAIKFRGIPSEDSGLQSLEGQIDVHKNNISFDEAKEIVIKTIKG